MWPLGWSFSTLGCCQLLRRSVGGGPPLSLSTSSRALIEGPGTAPLKCWLCWSLGGVGPTPPSDTGGRQPAMRARAALYRTFPLSCPLRSPDALTWALGDPQMIPSNGEPLKSSLHCPPSGSPSVCCLRCPFFNAPSKQSLLVLPEKASPSCSLPGTPTKCPT